MSGPDAIPPSAHRWKWQRWLAIAGLAVIGAAIVVQGDRRTAFELAYGFVLIASMLTALLIVGMTCAGIVSRLVRCGQDLRRRPPVPGHCPFCGYDLDGLPPAARCPECGRRDMAVLSGLEPALRAKHCPRCGLRPLGPSARFTLPRVRRAYTLAKGGHMSKTVQKPRSRGTAKLAVLFGVLLILLGAGVYIASEMESITALIPAFVGAALAVCGFIGLKRPAGAYVALIVGALGAAAALSRIVPVILDSDFQFDLKYGSQATMAALCAVFVIAGLISLMKGPKQKA